MRYLEDLQIGDRFLSTTHLLDAEQIIEFAQRFDPQPFHLDDDAARSTLFKGLAASGWHTAAITMRLQLSCQLNLAGGMIGAGIEIKWPTPTRPGDILQAEIEIVEIRISKSRPDRGIVKARTVTRNQRQEIVQDLYANLIVPCRPPEDQKSDVK